jgi:YwiC-like protein
MLNVGAMHPHAFKCLAPQPSANASLWLALRTRSLRSTLKQYVIPPEHGGWFLWIGPFLLGAVAAGEFKIDLLLLLLLIAAGYLSRQPLIILVKALAGRRARADAVPALRVFVLIVAAAALLFAALLLRGHLYLLWLGLPALPVLALQLWLVARRQERQMGIELIGSGVLALAAPAAYWVGLAKLETTGWWLWALSWLYNASAIVYVYLRLQQRRLPAVLEWGERWRQGGRVLLYSGFNLAITLALAALALLPPFVPAVYALALLHFIYGISIPAVGARPVRIGVEQSSATLVFYLLLALAFRI